MGGINLSHFIFRQLPVLPPATYTAELLAFIVPRVLELTYTAWDVQPFAQDCGYNGPPFVWDEARRFLLRCELDALYTRRVILEMYDEMSAGVATYVTRLDPPPEDARAAHPANE